MVNHDDDQHRANLSYSDSDDDIIRTSSKEDDDDDDAASSSSSAQAAAETIALFGVSGPTGHHFLREALEAGYRVRVLVNPGKHLDGSEEFADNNDHVHIVYGKIDDTPKIHEVVYGATYVVCMLGEEVVSKKSTKKYSVGRLHHFVKLLYPIMIRQDDPVIKGFLFQATSLASDGSGNAPVLSKLMRKVTSKQRGSYLQDLDSTIKFICSQHNNNNNNNNNRSGGKDKKKVPPFFYIVTRPSFILRDGPSTKKLAASKSQPGPFPCSNVDLAKFSLDALLMRKLFNSCPYVVGDGIY